MIYIVVIAVTPEVNHNFVAEGRSLRILQRIRGTLTKVARISNIHYHAKFKRKTLSGTIFSPISKLLMAATLVFIVGKILVKRTLYA
jgi:hypothetical protein